MEVQSTIRIHQDLGEVLVDALVSNLRCLRTHCMRPYIVDRLLDLEL